MAGKKKDVQNRNTLVRVSSSEGAVQIAITSSQFELAMAGDRSAMASVAHQATQTGRNKEGVQFSPFSMEISYISAIVLPRKGAKEVKTKKETLVCPHCGGKVPLPEEQSAKKLADFPPVGRWGVCPGCGYDATMEGSSRCPSCGTGIPREEEM